MNGFTHGSTSNGNGSISNGRQEGLNPESCDPELRAPQLRTHELRVHELRVVALANTPRLMREALERALDGMPGILVINLDGDPEKVEELSQQVQVDWLIVTLENGPAMSRRVRRLLHRIPSLSLLAISPDGERVEVLIERGGQLRRFNYWGVRLTSLIDLLRHSLDGAGITHFPPVIAATPG